MPEVKRWKRGRPSQAMIDEMVQQIRDGWTIPEGMKIPDSVQEILNPPVETPHPEPDFLDEVIAEGTKTNPEFPAMVDEALEARQEEKATRRSAKRDAEEARTAHIVRVRTADDYRPFTDPATIRSAIENYRQFQKWYEEDKVSEAALRTAEMHYLRIPEEMRKTS